MSEQVTIYALVDPRDGAMRYIGRTAQALEVRLAQHIADRGARRKAAWVAELDTQGLRPSIVALEVVPLADASAAEHRQINAARRRGADLTNGELQRNALLTWRGTLSLTKIEGERLVRTAQARDIPVAMLLRHIIRDYVRRARAAAVPTPEPGQEP